MIPKPRHLLFPLLAAAALAVAPAQAHPHVWVLVKSDLVYSADGALTAVRHHWTFDEMFSTFATQGMDAKKPGGLTREELAPLAELNVTSLKDFGYFTIAKADGQKPEFRDATDYWLEHKNGALTLHFTLPLKRPEKLRQINLEIYDPTYFVDFALFQRDPVTLVDAPIGCNLTARGPRDAIAAIAKPPNEAFFRGIEASNYGSQFANKISVTCP